MSFLTVAFLGLLALSAPVHAIEQEGRQQRELAWARHPLAPGTMPYPASSPRSSPPQQPAAQSSPRIIQRIEIVGNRRIQRETIRGRMFSREGEPVNEELLSRDFQALWNTQFFEDIRLEEEPSADDPNAVILVWYVQERPVIRRIEYRGIKSITESDILERFKDRRVGLSVESMFDPTRIKRAEVVIKELLSERGRQFAEIRPTYERIAATNAVRLIFNVEEGPKVKVGKIEIEGNSAFSDRRIIRSMRHSRPVAIPMGLFHINLWSKTFDRRRLNEDQEIGIRGLYQDHGYFRVLVKDPELEVVDINRGGLPGPWPLIGRKRGKRTNITIEVEEGELYRMGELFIRNADPSAGLQFPVEALKQVFPLKKGDVFAVDKVREALSEYRKLYGQYGYIDFTANPLTDVDVANRQINLTLEFDEQKRFIVRRIEFTGNTTTRDKVIRREILLDEGDAFDSRRWELSILRLNQLDYFEPIKAEENVEMRRNVREGTVDLHLRVQEKGRQSIGLTGGISGIAGSFVGFSYQTNNFLGLGETLSFSADFGDRQRNFLFGYTKPFLFDRPISVGFTLFATRFSFDQAREASLLLGRRIELDPATTQNFNQESKGFSIFASYPLRRFSFTRVGLTYSLTNSNLGAFNEATRLLFENLQFRSLAGPSALRGIRSSRIVPTLSYNTVDHPINPTRGKSLYISTSFEGGPLQGNVNAVTEVIEAKYFRPINRRRNTLGFRVLAAFATGYGGQVLPPFNRFYIGGEDTVRGFDYRFVTPVAFVPSEQTLEIFYLDPTRLDDLGNPRLQFLNVPVLDYSITLPGGDSQLVGNAEYRIPLVGQVVGISLFFDAGLNGVLRRNQLQLDPEGINRLRQRFPGETIRGTLDLAPKTNFGLRTSTGLELVVQLPVVNAPFRIYWAYNLNRLRTNIFEPRGAFRRDHEIFNTLPPLVREFQVFPQLDAAVTGAARRFNFFEPARTFRFTVSRTF